MSRPLDHAEIMDGDARKMFVDHVNNFLFCLIDRLVIHDDRIHVDHGLTAKFFLQFLLDPIDHIVDLKDIAIP